MVEAPPPVVTVGNVFTVIARVAVLLHPAALTPVTVYVVVTVGVAVKGVPVLALRPVVGDQEYVAPPVAPIVVDEPVHIEVAPPVVAMVGNALTVMVLVAVLLQPLPLMPVTV